MLMYNYQLWNNALRRRKLHEEWTTMNSANIRVGITTCSLACWRISFCGISRSAWGKKAPALTVAQVRRLRETIFPLQRFTLEDVLRLVKRTQERNHTAYFAHRKQRDERGEVMAYSQGRGFCE